MAISNTYEKLFSFFTFRDTAFLRGGNAYKALQLSFFTFGDTAFLRGGNPYNALQFKMAYYSFMRVQEVYTITVQI